MPKPSTYILSDDYTHLEDKAMKSAAQFFGEEMLHWAGIHENLKQVMPTEIIHLEARALYQDFNYETTNGCWYHFEFESDALTIKDLKRFREYEAATSRVFQVPVVTCVICSSKSKSTLSEYTEGINTYRVKIISLKGKNADKLFKKLLKKQKIRKKDVIPLLFSPFMSGNISVKNRILSGLKLIQDGQSQFTNDEIQKMQAVLYAFANKLLNTAEMNEIREVIAMTKLGQMILEDGIERGLEKGIQSLIETCKEFNLSKKETLIRIIDKFSLSEEKAQSSIEKYWKE
nr:hypothetical protein [uncultured Blautia sp.]